MENKEVKKTVDVFEANKTRFEALTTEDAKKWFETHDLIERDVQDICRFLRNYQNDKDSLLEIMRFIITEYGGWRYSKKRKDTVLQIIEQLELDDKELSEIHMLMYLYSYEWGSSLIDKDEFLNSIRLSSDIARNTFYSELPEVIISHSGRITKGLLDALFAVGYDKDSIITIWRNAFDIMKLRFPNLDHYPIDNVLEETDELLGLGKEETREETDEYAKNSVYRDPIMQVVDTCGIDYVELYERLHASSRLNNKIRAFVGGGSKMPETNTVYKSYVIQYALHAIIEKAYRDRKPELIPQNLFRLIPDYQGMYRLFKCHEMQPQNHLYDKNNSCEPFIINNKAEYILVGSFEIRKQIDYHQVSWVYAYQGIVGEDDEENQIPFQQCLVSSIENGECCVISSNLGALIEFRRTFDLELEDEGYLWPGMTVSKLLNVHIKFDFLNGRYIAVNQDNDIVFIMKKWSSSYKGDSEYPGNAIPLYSGTELYIKKEYIEMLEKQFGTLMMKTCVKSYTQTY